MTLSFDGRMTPASYHRAMHHTLNLPYSLWSRGRLLAETDLGFIYRENRYRCGWLHPTEIGERLLPDAAGVAPAMRVEFMIGPDATAHADLLAAVDREEALELELRGPDGCRIETEDIGVRDTHYLLSLADHDSPDDKKDEEPLTPEQEAEIEEFVAAWRAEHEGDLDLSAEDEVEFPRYQIQIRLVDDASVP
jgi:hypothetical protein